MKKKSYSQILSHFFNGYSIKSFIFASVRRGDEAVVQAVEPHGRWLSEPWWELPVCAKQNGGDNKTGTISVLDVSSCLS